MHLKSPRRKAASIAQSRWATYAVAGAATSLVGLATAEADIHYSGTLNVPFTGSAGQAFALDNGASLAFNRIDDGAQGGFARMGLNAGGEEIGLFAADGGRESSVSGFYLERLPARAQVSQLHMQRSCTSFSSTLRCFAATIGAWFLSGDHFDEPGKGFLAFSFDTGAGREYGWARIKTTGTPDFNFVLIDYAWADAGTPIKTGQTGHRATNAAVSKTGSLGLLATGAHGVKAWRQERTGSASH